jgi:hypothetical protein
LSLLDLRRGWALGLPSGQAIARAMGLPEDLIVQPGDFAELGAAGVPLELLAFQEETPLWYYCLKEAEVFSGGEYLGPVCGRIVAEVLLGLLEGDPSSYLRVDPRWLPEQRFGARLETDAAGQERRVFEMADLLAFATATLPTP